LCLFVANLPKKTGNPGFPGLPPMDYSFRADERLAVHPIGSMKGDVKRNNSPADGPPSRRAIVAASPGLR